MVEHLGVLIDTRQMRVFVTDRKVKRMRKMAQEILLCAQRNRRLVPVGKLRHFCGVAVSLTLALPMARFYTRSLYWDMSLAGLRAEERGQSQSEVPRAGRAERGPRVGTSVTLPERRSAASSAKPSASQRMTLTCQSHRAPEMAWVKVRLSRQSLRDLRYWRSLTRGEGRDLQPPPADLTMHSDAADVGYGGTLGTCSDAGSPGLWEGHGLWAAKERAEPITLRELKAVRLLLQRHFASFAARAETRNILLHEDNQAVVHILNAMVSASRPMMAELRRLQVMLRVLGVRLEARWLPSAVNRFADALSRQWDPGDVSATAELVNSLCASYEPDAVVFPYRPVGEHPIARRKYLAAQMAEYWGDGRARLWNPPFDFLPLVLKKVEDDRAHGIMVAPRWPAQPWYGRLMRLATCVHVLTPAESARYLSGQRALNPGWELVVAELGLSKTGVPPSAMLS